MKTNQTTEIEKEYIHRIMNDTSSATTANVDYPQDLIWARIWLQTKPYGVVNLEGWTSIEQAQKFAKKAHAKLDSDKVNLYLIAK